MRLRFALSVIVALLVGVVSMPMATAVEGDPPNQASFGPAVSADGRWIAFVSKATNLLGGDPWVNPEGVTHVFLVDTDTSTIWLVSGAGGVLGNGTSKDVAISADGRFVVFETAATNLVPADANNANDIVLFDRESGALTLVSRRGAAGAQGDGDSFAPTISNDGTKVAFGSRATNLVANDTNAKADIFVRDVVAGATSRVSTDSSGRQSNNASYDAAIAPTGAFVALSSLASNLVAGDTNGTRDVFLKNLTSAKMLRVSVTNTERQAKGNSGLEDISADGRSVVFTSFAANLVKNDGNGTGDVFVRDRVGATTIRASRRGAIEGNDESFDAAISDDGRFVVFRTKATNLDLTTDDNGKVDVYEYRVDTKEVVRISIDVAGGWTDGDSDDAAIAGDGSVVAFASFATDLVIGDDNGFGDVFVHAWTDDARIERVVSWWSGVLPAA